MPSVRDKAIIGIGGSIGFSLVAWRTLFPWIGYDLEMMKHGKKIAEESKKDSKGDFLAIDLFERSVKQVPTNPFVIFNDRIYTYEFMNEQACKVANIAFTLGLKLGDTVAILMLNEPAFIWTFLGLQKIGVACSFLNPHNRQKPLLHTINVSEAKLLIVGQGQELREAVEDIIDSIDTPIYLSGTVTGYENFKSWDALMMFTPPAEICRTLRASIDVDSPICYAFTSGTTGLPKPTPISQAKILSLTRFLLAVNFGSDDVVYTVLPLYHTVGLASVLTTLRMGGKLVLREKFSSHHFFDDCRKHNVTVIQYIGELCRYLLALPESSKDKEHNIRVAIGNGLRKDIWEKFMKRFNINSIAEFYGSTEGTGNFFSMNGRPGAIGRLSPLMKKLAPWPVDQHLIKYDQKNEKPYRNKENKCVPAGIGYCCIRLP